VNTIRDAVDNRRRWDAEKSTQAHRPMLPHPCPMLPDSASDGGGRHPVWQGVHFPESP